MPTVTQDTRTDVPGILSSLGPPGEWSGAVAGTLTSEARRAVLRAWRSMSAEERNTIIAKWRERFDHPADKTATAKGLKLLRAAAPEAVAALSARLHAAGALKNTPLGHAVHRGEKSVLGKGGEQVSHLVFGPEGLQVRKDMFHPTEAQAQHARERFETAKHAPEGLLPRPIHHIEAAPGQVSQVWEYIPGENAGEAAARESAQVRSKFRAWHDHNWGDAGAVRARRRADEDVVSEIYDRAHAEEQKAHAPLHDWARSKGLHIGDLGKNTQRTPDGRLRVFDWAQGGSEAEVQQRIRNVSGLGEFGPSFTGVRAQSAALKKTAALPISKEQREAKHRANTHFRSDDPKKWDDFLDHAKRKSFVTAVQQDTRSDAKLERHVDQMNRLLTGKEIEKVRVGDGGEYSITRLRGGGVGCTCPDWRYKKSVAGKGEQDCKHIVAWRESKMYKKTASVLSSLAAHPKTLFAAGTAAGLGALAVGLHRNAKSTQFTPEQKQMRSLAMHEAAGLGMLMSPYATSLAASGAEVLSRRPGRVGIAARAAHSVLEPLSHTMHGSGHGAHPRALSDLNELVGLGILLRPSIQEMHHLHAKMSKHGAVLAGMQKDARVQINIPHLPERIRDRIPGVTLQQGHAITTKIQSVLAPLGGHTADLPSGRWKLKIPGHGQLVFDRLHTDRPGVLRTMLLPGDQHTAYEGTKNLAQAFPNHKQHVEAAAQQIKTLLDQAQSTRRG